MTAGGRRVECRRLAVAAAIWLVSASVVSAAWAALEEDPDLSRARQLIDDARYAEAYELLLPHEQSSQDDAAFNVLLGEAALRSDRAEQAKTHFEQALATQPGSVEGHLGLGRAYLALGNYAAAKIEFETVLRLDDLPAGLQQQVEIYAAAAQPYATGRNLLGNGYGMIGYGNYHTSPIGGGPDDDQFMSLRTGGNVNYELPDGFSLNGSLDYRYRNYTGTRRDDSDLRWNAASSRNFGEGNLVVGFRGRRSFRGNGIYRNDWGFYTDWRQRMGEKDQISVGAEIRQRLYPSGTLEYRSRNIFEASAGWTRSLFSGRASFELGIQGGYEFETERPDGDAGFIGLSPSFNATIVDNLDAFVFGWWQNERFTVERLHADGDNVLALDTRNDNLYEVGGGLIWQFAPHWSLNPEVLWIRDDSNVVAFDYSSIEAWFTVRFDF
jgi:tetratricopeptide (TPR) repeat protein